MWFAVAAAAVLALDQFTKLLIVRALAIGESRDLIGGSLRLHHVRNRGASFGVLQGSSGLLALAAIVGAAVFAWILLRDPSWRVGLPVALVTGGALGNLADRAFRPWPFGGSVVDFIDLPWWPTFNVADSAITIGAIVLIGSGMFEKKGDGDPDNGDRG